MACEYMISKTGSNYTSFEMCLGMEMISIHCWAACTRKKKKKQLRITFEVFKESNALLDSYSFNTK